MADTWTAGFFVDFETVSNLKDDFTRFPDQGCCQELIFMIGCGHVEDGEWQFPSFITRDLERSVGGYASLNAWLDTWKTFAADWRPALLRSTGVPLVACGGQRAGNSYRSARRATSGNAWPPGNGSISSAGGPAGAGRRARRYGIRAQGDRQSPPQHKLIETIWGDGPRTGSELWSGPGGVRTRSPTRHSLAELPLMQEIARYNEVDCRVMTEGYHYLRIAH